jgi:hypothetical protein
MLRVVIGLVLIMIGIQALLRRGKPLDTTGQGRAAAAASLLGAPLTGILMVLVGLGFLASTSFVLIGADKVGHLKRIYLADDLPPGRIIALPGQKGPQAEVLGPGFHFRPLLNVLFEVEPRDVILVPEGFYGQITTMDGAPMPEGMFIAPVIPDGKLASMLDAQTYIEEGGFRGPQETVLKPGSYRLNQYLFDTRVDSETTATTIPTGQVGVVKSNVQQPGLNCKEEMVRVSQAQHDTDALSVPLVPRGCIGLWKEPLLPGAYYLNKHAYDVTLVDTRVQTAAASSTSRSISRATSSRAKGPSTRQCPKPPLTAPSSSRSKAGTSPRNCASWPRSHPRTPPSWQAPWAVSRKSSTAF